MRTSPIPSSLEVFSPHRIKKLGFFLILGILSISAASACSDEAQPNLTHTPTPYAGGTTETQSTDPQTASLNPTDPGESVPRSTSENLLRDIPQSQHDQLDLQISELTENIEILAECAVEAGDAVPQPGSLGEPEWYAKAAIVYSACATSKATGVDFTGGS